MACAESSVNFASTLLGLVNSASVSVGEVVNSTSTTHLDLKFRTRVYV